MDPSTLLADYECPLVFRVEPHLSALLQVLTPVTTVLTSLLYCFNKSHSTFFCNTPFPSSFT